MRNGMTGFARIPVFPETPRVGALTARSGRSSIRGRAFDLECPFA